MSRYERAKKKARNYAFTVDLTPFTKDELCDLYVAMDTEGWSDKIGKMPRRYDEEFWFEYPVAVMDRIEGLVGREATHARWLEANTVSEKKNRPELEQLARPLVGYIREKHNPYTVIVISYDGVKVMAVDLSLPCPENHAR